jgi:hypothetical protein
MYKPYEAVMVNPFFSKVTFEGDTIFTYLLDYSEAKLQANLFNNIYALGVMKACNLADNREEILKVLK